METEIDDPNYGHDAIAALDQELLRARFKYVCMVIEKTPATQRKGLQIVRDMISCMAAGTTEEKAYKHQAYNRFVDLAILTGRIRDALEGAPYAGRKITGEEYSTCLTEAIAYEEMESAQMCADILGIKLRKKRANKN